MLHSYAANSVLTNHRRFNTTRRYCTPHKHSSILSNNTSNKCYQSNVFSFHLCNKVVNSVHCAAVSQHNAREQHYRCATSLVLRHYTRIVAQYIPIILLRTRLPHTTVLETNSTAMNKVYDQSQSLILSQRNITMLLIVFRAAIVQGMNQIICK